MLGDVKRLLGFADDTQDDKLTQIIGMVESRLKLKLGGVVAVPGALSYIVAEVTVSRYNQISSEGTSSHSIDGVSMTWLDDIMFPYLTDMQDYLDQQNGAKKVRFL